MIIKRIIALSKTIIYWFKTIKCVRRSIILDAQDTVEYIVKNKKSLIRYGDGEFYIMEENSIHYQEYSDSLKEILINIIEDYLDKPNEKEYFLCMPKRYFECSGFKLLQKKIYIISWVKPRYIFSKRYDRNVTYGDAFLFAKGNEKIYEKIWESNEIQRVVFVHNEKKYASDFAKRYRKNVAYIPIVSQNVFENAGAILEKIVESVIRNRADIVLISAGPCAKYLVMRLSEMGIWAIDTGHCWDEPLI